MRQFQKKLINEGFKFTRILEKPFGQRIVCNKSSRLRTEKRILIYNFARKQPSLVDFSKFLTDFKRFMKKGENGPTFYDVEVGFFLVTENCPKDLLEAFKIVLKHGSEDVKMVKVVQLKS